MVDLFNDPEFEKYREMEIEEGIQALRQFMMDGSSEYLRGSMDMLKRIIKVPMKIIPTNNESQKQQAEILAAKAFDAFEAKIMRKFILEDE